VLGAVRGADAPLLSPPVAQRTGRNPGVPETGNAQGADGSFKFRGAFKQAVVDPACCARAAWVAFSSGNHAQAWRRRRKSSHASDHLMPSDAPLSKRERTKAYGAEVVLYDRDREIAKAHRQ